MLDCQTSDKTKVSKYGEAGGGIEWERGSSNHKSLSYTKCIRLLFHKWFIEKSSEVAILFQLVRVTTLSQ